MAEFPRSRTKWLWVVLILVLFTVLVIWFWMLMTDNYELATKEPAGPEVQVILPTVPEGD